MSTPSAIKSMASRHGPTRADENNSIAISRVRQLISTNVFRAFDSGRLCNGRGYLRPPWSPTLTPSLIEVAVHNTDILDAPFAKPAIGLRRNSSVEVSQARMNQISSPNFPHRRLLRVTRRFPSSSEPNVSACSTRLGLERRNVEDHGSFLCIGDLSAIIASTGGRLAMLIPHRPLHVPLDVGLDFRNGTGGGVHVLDPYNIQLHPQQYIHWKLSFELAADRTYRKPLSCGQ